MKKVIQYLFIVLHFTTYLIKYEIMPLFQYMAGNEMKFVERKMEEKQNEKLFNSYNI